MEHTNARSARTDGGVYFDRYSHKAFDVNVEGNKV